MCARKNFYWLLISLALCSAFVGCVSQSAITGEFELFDGHGLSGWAQVGDARWKTENGEVTIVGASGDGMLVWGKQYDDFKLTVEFWVDEQVNSGIFVRCNSTQDISPINCYEVNIWDKHPKQEFRTGSIVMHVSPPLAHVDTIGKWNRYEIMAVDSRISVVLNGVTTAELIDRTHRKGFIALQRANAGQVRFRNMEIELL